MYNPNRFLLIVLWFVLFMVSGASQAIDNITSNPEVNPNFNLNNLYTKNKYSAMEQWGYDASAAQVACNDLNGKYIWSEDPNDPFPDPRPTPADCGETEGAGDMHAQMAYGCKVDPTKPDSIGAKLSNSVVFIMIPALINAGMLTYRDCSGVVIGRYNDWVLTAGHCVVENAGLNRGGFNLPLVSHPPIILDKDKLQYLVDMIYVPRDLEYYRSPIYNNYGTQDFALLHLQKPLPSSYKPIDLMSNTLPDQIDGSLNEVWVAGYGQNENGAIGKGTFTFRRAYFMTSEKRDEPKGEHGDLYLHSSKPILYKNILSNWTFVAPGDSGGAVAVYDKITNRFGLFGVLSATICSYPGYFARSHTFLATSIPYFYKLITSIMNGRALSNDVRCISYNGGCDRHTQYVLNMGWGAISTYTGVDNNRLRPDFDHQSGPGATQIVTSDNTSANSYVFVTDFMGNYISIYKRMLSGELIDLHNNFQLKGRGPVDIAAHNDYVYVVENTTPQIDVYQINGREDNLIYKKSLFANVDATSISIIGNYAYVLNSGYTIGKYISIYDLSAPDGGKFSYNYRLDDVNGGIDGNLLQVIGGIDPNQLYLLTTRGVYLFDIQMVNGLPRLVLMAKTSNDLIFVGGDARIQPITSDRVAVSSGKTNNKLFVLQKGGVQLFKVQELTTPSPVGMSFASISDNYTSPRRLYVTNRYSRMMTEYTLNPVNNKLENPREFSTGEQPFRVIYRNWRIPAE